MKGLVTFFAFLVPFLAVSTYFGGGLVGIGVSIILAIVVAGVLLVLWPRVRQQTQVLAREVSRPSKGDTLACQPGPYAVVAGTPTKVSLNVGAGDKLRGHLQEIDGDFFDWYIVDEKNLVLFLNDEDCYYIDGDENVQACRVKSGIPHSGPWYLLLDIGNRRYDRKVEVNLRVISA